MPKIVKYLGERFARLVVIGTASHRGHHPHWVCRCDCGNEVTVSASNLRSGMTRSCGCLAREVAIALNTTHERTRTTEHTAWVNMRQRCSNPNNPSFDKYGGRGIRVCSRWLESFENFFADMGERPPATSLDRKDNNGNYEPGNCRWATFTVQVANRRPFTTKASLRLDVSGEVKTIHEWARLRSLRPSTIYGRLDSGWTPERAVNTPTDKRYATR